jgi:hypothetical protein
VDQAQIAWKAQCPLSARYRALTRKGKLRPSQSRRSHASSPLSSGRSTPNRPSPCGSQVRGLSRKKSCVHILFREPVPGQRSGDVTYRATAGAKPRQGNPRFCYVADRKIDARVQTQDSPRRRSGHAAQIRGSEHDHRRVKASPPPLHDHNLNSSGTDCGRRMSSCGVHA